MGYADLIALYDKQNKEKEDGLRNELRNAVIIKHSIETTIMGVLGSEGELPGLADYFDQFGLGDKEKEIEVPKMTAQEVMDSVFAVFEADDEGGE